MARPVWLPPKTKDAPIIWQIIFISRIKGQRGNSTIKNCAGIGGWTSPPNICFIKTVKNIKKTKPTSFSIFWR